MPSALRRRGRHRHRHHPRPPGRRLQPGLHHLRRLARRGCGREDHQGHGARAQDRCADHRHPRLGRRAHPGGRRRARQVRRDLPPQHGGVGRHPADLDHLRACGGRRGLLPRPHRLRSHGRQDEPDVRHRPRRHQDGHGRGRRHGGARRRAHPQPRLGRRALPRRRRERRLRLRPHPC